MKNIMTAFLLIFLDFNLNLGNSQIGLIPDFIGYIVMINGLAELSGESQQFIKIKPCAVGMAVYTAIVYLLDLLGISAAMGSLAYVFAIVSAVISLYISYCIIMGIREMESNYHTCLDSDSLYSIWKVLAVLNVVVFFAVLLPVAGVIFIILTVLVNIYFLVAFSRAKDLYENMKAQGTGKAE